MQAVSKLTKKPEEAEYASFATTWANEFRSHDVVAQCAITDVKQG